MPSITIHAIKAGNLGLAAVVAEIDRELEKEGEQQVKELKKTVATWEGSRPTFEALTERSGADVTVLTGPTGSSRGVQKWNWLDQGTKRGYPIVPRRARFLRFRGGPYTAKTMVNWFGSRRGGPSGDFVFRKRVWHPGIAPRRWSTGLQEKRQRPFGRRIDKAVKRGLRAAGKGGAKRVRGKWI